MFYSVDGRIVEIDGRLPVFQDNTLTFQVFGPEFPFSNISNNNRRFELLSFTTNTAEINWGDGNIEIIDFKAFGSNYILEFDSPGSTYTYQDGSTTNRVISFKIEKPLEIISIGATRTNLGPIFPSNISRFISIETIDFVFGTGIETFPESIKSLSKLKELTFDNATTTIQSVFPLEILNLTSLEFLNIRSGFDFSNHELSNFNKFNLLQNTLKTLYLDALNIDSFPSNFKELNVEFLSAGGNKFNEIGPNIPLTVRTFALRGSTRNFNSYNRIEQLTNLESFGAERIRDLVVQEPLLDIPSNFNQLTKLKRFSLLGDIIETTQNIDRYINSWYDFITLNASINQGDTLFRQMSINTGFGLKGAVPRGTYQQPTEFQLGVSNGTPISPQEKVWVLVNQYEHTWIINFT